jgi:hypothetical protein
MSGVTLHATVTEETAIRIEALRAALETRSQSASADTLLETAAPYERWITGASDVAGTPRPLRRAVVNGGID